MNKIKELNKKQKTVIAAVVVLAILLIALGIMALTGDKEDKKIDVKEVSAGIEEQLDSLSEEEKVEVKELETAMEEELNKAGSEKEKEKILDKYTEKISNASGNKVTVEKPSTSKDKPSKPNSSGSSNTGSSSTKPSTGNENKKPDSGSSSGSTGSTGSESKPEKPSEPEKPSKPQELSKPSHTHIAEGNMGWANSSAEIIKVFETARDKWQDKVAAGDTTSKEPINYSYKKCGCGKYTGTIVYGKPHSHIQVGNTGKWFKTDSEAEACVNAEQKKWGQLWGDFKISDEEYAAKCPVRYEIRQCSCGKYTLSWWTRANDN